MRQSCTSTKENRITASLAKVSDFYRKAPKQQLSPPGPLGTPQGARAKKELKERDGRTEKRQRRGTTRTASFLERDAVMQRALPKGKSSFRRGGCPEQMRSLPGGGLPNKIPIAAR